MNTSEVLVLAVVSFAAAAFGAYMTVYFTAKREQGSLKLPGVSHGPPRPPPQMEPRPVPGTGEPLSGFP